MATSDLYGFLDDDLERVRALVEQALGITMIAGHSVYRGAYYCYRAAGAEQLIIQRNWDPLDQECMEEQFPEMRVLLYANPSLRAADLERTLRAQTAVRLLAQRDEL